MSLKREMQPGSPDGQVVFIRSATVGRGDDELGGDLMMNFLHQLSGAEQVPDSIIMMNAGVKLVVEGSEVLDSLQSLENRGAAILACGTCLNFFRIKDKQKVGKASNMVEITQVLLSASKVVTV